MRRLDIVGLGIGAGSSFSADIWQRLQAADLVFSMLMPDRGALSALKTPYLDLHAQHAPTTPPHIVYRSIIDQVLDESRSWKRAALVATGNPLLFNFPVRQIMERARRAGWSVDCLPATSSIDAVIVDLELDVAADGLQIFDTYQILPPGLPINPGLGCLLLQVASLLDGRGYADNSPRSPEVFGPLRDHLLELYSESHPFFVVRARSSPEESSEIMLTSIGDFPRFAGRIDNNCSAYIPPRRQLRGPSSHQPQAGSVFQGVDPNG